ncbi:MAG: MoaD/ThiS family protein [Acidobacteriota bacterium]|jgi:sulfur carrier protein ThiS
MIKVRLIQQDREVEVSGPIRVERLLERLGLRRTTHVVLLEGQLLTPDRTIEDGETVDLISVVSGGARG